MQALIELTGKNDTKIGILRLNDLVVFIGRRYGKTISVDLSSEEFKDLRRHLLTHREVEYSHNSMGVSLTLIDRGEVRIGFYKAGNEADGEVSINLALDKLLAIIP